MHPLLPEPSQPKRRRYSAEFKTLVVNASYEPGRSVASVARHYQLNANLLHNWRRQMAGTPTEPPGDFIALPVPDASHPHTPPQTVRIDCPSGITVHWPIHRITESVSWLKALVS